MYSDVGDHLRCGDLFADLPMPLYESDRFALDRGPAMLVDGDCSICKPRVQSFRFAAMFPLDEFDHGMQGSIRNGDVRRLLYLPAHPSLDNEEFVVDFEEWFSLPRSYFALQLIDLHGDEHEKRWLVDQSGPSMRRLLSLNDQGRTKLKVQMALYLELEAAVLDRATDGPDRTAASPS